MEIDFNILKNVAPEDVAEVIEAERETIAAEAERAREYQAYLDSLNRHKRHNIKRRAKKACHRAFDRAIEKGGVPAGVTKDDPEIMAFYELAVAMEKVTGIPHSVDHRIPLNEVCRKTWLATGVKRQTACGLHHPNNLEVVPLSYNRGIKKDWFDSDWPAWTSDERYDEMFDADEDVEDRIPF